MCRVLPLWNTVIAPLIKSGKRVLIVAHGNSLRALIKHIDNISDEAIVNLNLPTGTTRGAFPGVVQSVEVWSGPFLVAAPGIYV